MSVVDKTKIKPVPIQKTLTLVNNFIVNTTCFMNSFSENVEKKISKLSSQITDMETLLAVLEAKLNSVPELQDIQAAAPPAPAPQASTASTTPTSASNSSASAPSAPAAPAAEAPPPTSEFPEEYKTYERMLKVGVPMFVVQAKATTAGHDPAIVEKIAASLGL